MQVSNTCCSISKALSSFFNVSFRVSCFSKLVCISFPAPVHARRAVRSLYRLVFLVRVENNLVSRKDKDKLRKPSQTLGLLKAVRV